MLVVSDTSPVLNLAVIGRLEFLRQQFGPVWLPQAVIDELRSEQDLPGSAAVLEALHAGWLVLEPVADPVRVALLQRDLDRGEAEAIALALQKHADWLLLDERDGRRVAKSLGLQVTGVLGILLQARLKGQLPSLREAMDQLRDLADFRIGAALYAELLQAADEGEAD
jgi:predicted nucleic acid-binding protein